MEIYTNIYVKQAGMWQTDVQMDREVTPGQLCQPAYAIMQEEYLKKFKILKKYEEVKKNNKRTKQL